jgi:beta-lactam-binding protein with PASTA domain
MPSRYLGRWWRGLARLFRWLIVAGGLTIIALLSAWLTVILVIRGREVMTPDLVGLKAEEALAQLEQDGLKLQIQESRAQYSEQVPAGQILKQSPEAGSWLKLTRKVKVILSRGPQRLPMPDLVENSVRHSRIVIGQSGFKMGSVAYAWWDGMLESRIVAQDPAPAQEEYYGRRVNLLVSRGVRDRSWVMPDLIGLDQDRVRQHLASAGFRLGVVKHASHEGLEQGLIVAQSPPAGHPVTRKRFIELTVNRWAYHQQAGYTATGTVPGT